MKKIIVIEQENKFQYDSIEELVKELLDENYYNINEEQKYEILKRKAALNKINNNNQINIENEYTYILSLANLNIITVLERKDADIFLKGFDKEKFDGNYIIINKLAKDLLASYINNKE